MANNKQIGSNKKLSETVQISLFVAILVVLQLLATLLIKLGFVAPTIALIPIVLGGAVFGVKGGAILGLSFGVLTFLCGFIGLDVGASVIVSQNIYLAAVLCVAKAVLAGALSALAYKLLIKIFKNKIVPALIGSSIVVTTVNTLVYSVGISIFFRNLVVDTNKQPRFNENTAFYIVVAAVFTGVIANYIFELIVTTVCAPLVGSILAKSKKYSSLFAK